MSNSPLHGYILLSHALNYNSIDNLLYDLKFSMLISLRKEYRKNFFLNLVNATELTFPVSAVT